jgi:hypothetical protein
MHTLKTTTIVSAALISLLLSACGGSGSPMSNQGGSSSSLSSGSIDTTSPAFIGYGFDSSFVEGQIGVSIGAATLSPGGSTNLTVNIVSSTKTLASAATQITFNSPCIASGEAKLTTPNGGASTNVVSSNFGEATITYTANGCSGTDQITATAVIKGLQTNAKTTLNIASDTVLAVKAIDTELSQISLKGTGGQETAVVSFLVSGTTGAPIKNVVVDFSLSTEINGASLGGLALVNTSATSDKNGVVSTTVQAGNIATSVVVTAKARDTNIATQSKKLIVSTGIPDQDSITLGATDPFPMGWDHSGIESLFTVRLADAFNNPVTDGTAVSFTTEGGAIDDACTTTKGACTVTWRSQNPKPIRNSANNSVDRLLCVNSGGLTYVADYDTCAKERAGRVTVLAHAIGNESFIDTNGNGLYDYGVDIFKTHNDYPGGNPECDKNAPLSSLAKLSNSPRLACDDLGEAYLDRNENGSHDNDEPFIDLNLNGGYSTENGIYNGILCRDNDPNCTNKEKITIRQDSLLIMVSDNMLQSLTGFPYLVSNIKLDAIPKSSSSTSSAAASSSAGPAAYVATAFFWVADKNGNGAPAGTTLSIDTSSLKNATAKLSNEGPLAASEDPSYVEIRFASDDSGNKPSGFIKVSVTFPTPGGPLTTSDFVDVN